MLHEQWMCLGMQRHTHITTVLHGDNLIPISVAIILSLSTILQPAKLRLNKKSHYIHVYNCKIINVHKFYVHNLYTNGHRKGIKLLPGYTV